MKKVINFRFLFFLSIVIGALVLGICEIFRQNYFWAIMSLIVFGVAVVIILFYENRRINLIITLGLVVVCLVSTIATFCFWEGKDQKGEIIFTLTDQIMQDQNLLIGVGKNIKINDKKVKGKVQFFITLDDQSYLYGLQAGDRLMIYSGELVANSLSGAGYLDHNNYHQNIKYVLRCDEFDVRRYSGKPDMLSSLRYKVKEIIFENIQNQDAASISYAMITGNRDFISNDIYQSYKTAGLAHILAVSGMNISFLIICVSLVFFSFKGLRIFKLILMSVLIGFYCALCGFVPSVTRAGIMGIIMIVSKTFGLRLDSLNSLSFASILMLIFKPLYIYDLSFLLSFASVFCIVCLYSPLVKIFSKILKGKIGTKINQLIAMTLSANIGVYPLLAHYFNTFSMYSLIANLILLPLINLAFIILFAVCIIALILPFLAFLAVPVGWLLTFINAITRFLSALPYAELIIFSLGGLAALYYIIVFVMGGFLNIPKKSKAVVSIILSIFLALSVTLTNIPTVFAQDFYMAYSLPINQAGLAVCDNSKYIIGDVNQYNYSKIKKELINQKIRKIDCIIITATPSSPQTIIDFAQEFAVDKIALVTDDWGLCDEIKVKTQKQVVQIFDNIDYKIFDLQIFSYSYNNIRLGTHIIISGKKFLYPLVFDEHNLEILNTLSGGCDVLISNRYIEQIDYYMYLTFDSDSSSPNIINLSKNGNYSFLL